VYLDTINKYDPHKRWLLREAIGVLEEQGRAVLFPGSNSDEEGVKFADV
jgi:hypothetical protein